MTPLLIALLAAGGAGMALMMDTSSDEEDVASEEDLTEEQDPPEEPEEEEPDLGASVVELEDGRIEVELGEDETGSLLALVEEAYQNGGNSAGGEDVRMTLYLVPEDVELPANRLDLPDTATTDVYGAPFEKEWGIDWERDDIAGYYNLTELGEWDLGSVYSSSTNTQDGTGANTYYSDRTEIEFVSDSEIRGLVIDYISGQFLSDGVFRYHDDLSFLDGTQALHGTNDADVLIPTEDVSFVNGRAGDDFIEASEAVLKGGDGDDTIVGTDSNLIDGQRGDDFIIAKDNAAAWGGQGNDTLIGNGGPNMDLFGDIGDDTLIALTNSDLSGDHYSYREPGLAGTDTFMVSDQGLGSIASGEPVQISNIYDFNSSVDQLVVLTQDGNEPVSVVYEPRYTPDDGSYPRVRGGHLTLTYTNGSVGHIFMDEVDPANVTFRDLDDVLAIYAAESEPLAS